MESVEVYQNFNPRSPWGERLKGGVNMLSKIKFQSTLSVRRATMDLMGEFMLGIDFNPRSPWGERPLRPNSRGLKKTISIHALREESDSNEIGMSVDIICISIHALREESDKSKRRYRIYSKNFNPRSPWGERRVFISYWTIPWRYFNPRSPWGERPFQAFRLSKN